MCRRNARAFRKLCVAAVAAAQTPSRMHHMCSDVHYVHTHTHRAASAQNPVFPGSSKLGRSRAVPDDGVHVRRRAVAVERAQNTEQKPKRKDAPHSDVHTL